MKPWVKLYTEIIRDPDMGTLTWEQRGIWSAILALCGQIDDRDEKEIETGKLDTLANASWHLRCEFGLFSATVSVLIEHGMIEIRDNILYLPNYTKRQAVPPSQIRPANRDRQREHREDKSNNETVTTLSQPCHNLVTTLSQPCNVMSHPRLDIEEIRLDIDQSENRTDTDAETEASAAIFPAGNPDAAAIFTLFEKLDPRRQVTPLQAEDLADLLSEFGRERMEYAIHQASEHSAPTMAYIKGILKGNGIKPPGKMQPSKIGSNVGRRLE